MATPSKASSMRTQRAVTRMLAGQRMASAEPTKTDLDIASRQVAGELNADDAVAEAIAAARARFRDA